MCLLRSRAKRCRDSSGRVFPGRQRRSTTSLALLSAMLKKAVEWGELAAMPCTIGLLKNSRTASSSSRSTWRQMTAVRQSSTSHAWRWFRRRSQAISGALKQRHVLASTHAHPHLQPLQAIEAAHTRPIDRPAFARRRRTSEAPSVQWPRAATRWAVRSLVECPSYRPGIAAIGCGDR